MCRHFTEIKLAHCGEAPFEHCERRVGTVTLAPFRRARSSPGAGASQRQMWAERPVFARNAEFGCCHVDAPGQFRQLRSSVNSDPEDARSLRSWEESISACPNLECAAFDSPQAFGDGLDPLRRLFSDELQCNVQRLWLH